MIELLPADFCDLFSTFTATPRMLNHISKSNFKYEFLASGAYAQTVLKILQKLDSYSLPATGNLQRWEDGWAENLNEYKKSGDLNSLIPKYVHPDQVCRLFKRYIKTEDSNFELNFFYVLRYWLFETYFKHASEIFEFGCGSGYNLPVLADIYPGVKIHGLDWAQSSVDIVELMREKTGLSVYGHRFNMFEPDYSLPMPEKSKVITFGCLEQAGSNFNKFLDFFLIKKPKLVCNVEPIIEFYDKNNLPDYLAIMFHRQRNYLNNYYTRLKELESQGKIHIMKSHRMEFGSLYHDGWSIIIWEVL